MVMEVHGLLSLPLLYTYVYVYIYIYVHAIYICMSILNTYIIGMYKHACACINTWYVIHDT